MKCRVNIEETKNCLCLKARKTAREITRRYEEALRPFGLKATQFSILSVLAIKGRTQISELAELLGLERTSLSRSIDILEERNWVKSKKSSDGRERPMVITKQGMSTLESAFPHWQSVQQQVESETS
jgi:DNA-binding MarR family transcriptional regulator